MAKTKVAGIVNIYNEFIKDNPKENVFITRHPRDEEDLICFVTTTKVFQQIFPTANLSPIGVKKNGSIDNSKEKENPVN